MTRLHLDFETFSEIDIRKHGSDVYARHPSTEVLMLAWAFYDEDPQLWFPDQPMPASLRDALTDSDVTKVAWNATFEYQIFKHVLGIEIPFDQWLDPMVLAYSLSLPGQLGKVGKILSVDEDEIKLDSGTNLINWFCKPRNPTKKRPTTRVLPEHEPERWGEFCNYCLQDVIAERYILSILEKYDMPPEEWENWYLDREINERGLPIDRKLIDNAIALAGEERKRLIAEARRLTALTNPNSTEQLLGWLQARGYPYEDIAAESIKKARELEITETLDSVLELRQQWSKTSTKKFTAFKNRAADDGRLRNAFQFAGAGRTWRWAGRGVQLQNLPRGIYSIQEDPETGAEIVRNCDLETVRSLYDEPVMDVLASVTRQCLRAPDGYKFVVADLNAIENRVLGWVTECDAILEVFREGLDPYKAFGVHWMKVPYEKITKPDRTICKPAVLGAGYMLSGGEYIEEQDKYTGLWGYGKSMGVEMTRAQAHESVRVFRETYVEVPDYWGKVMAAATKTVRKKSAHAAGPVEFIKEGPMLRMRLPSGRFLSYVKPKMRPWEMPWGDVRESLTYENLNDRGQWKRISTHPGKLTENAVQAIARDLLMSGIRNAERDGFAVVGHVHDEIITLMPEDSPLGPKELCAAMSEPVPWAEDLPLGAGGYESIVFKKD